MERTSSATNSHRRAAYLFALIVLIADVSGMALAQETAADEELGFTDPILIDSLPPLMCDEELCLRPTRMIDRGDRPSAEDDMWWLSYGPDLDWNGMDDRLQRVLSGQESISPTAIVGDDGRKTVAIVVDYAWHPQVEELEDLERLLGNHGWIGEDQGAWYQVLDSLDAVVLDKVPVSALMDIYGLEGVVVIEMQNVMIPFNGVASKAAKSMPSDTYTNSTYTRGYNGEGVVVAVLDTGVDNEHRALNDFDDLSDEPDGDATSYDDQKWVAGFDATSASSNNDGTDDPDDGQGHGTHVAATAIGTGSSDRVHTGTGMGAYLVDIKVLTDSGGTNSQASISGMQWMINNKDTEWPGNGSAKGIDVASMSFGSVSSPLNPDDDGDNGSGAEARLVNTANDNGIVCVVAMGNDGNQRVPSPASADGALSIGAAEDRNTVNRTDDTMASYSNFGPRLDDGDDDVWDELKPDIIAYGSGITSATAAVGTSLPGQPERPLAANEYDSKDGTSMATPVVSGIVASLIQADRDTLRGVQVELTPEQIKDILRNSSEPRTSFDCDFAVTSDWDCKWGFGLVDASCALDLTLGGKECGKEVEEIYIVPMSINFTGPALGTKLSGLVEFTGMVEGTEAERIEFKIDRGDWTFGTDVANEDGKSVNWYFNWDSTASDDGQVDIKIRALNASGLKSNISMRSYIVDNIPPSPDFSFTGAVEIFDDGLQVNSALQGSILEIRFEIRNSGDLDANDIYVRLDGPGEDSATYPSDGYITSLAKGESAQATLYWWATEAGSHDVSVLIDPSDAQNDPKPEDNTYTFPFQVDERPVEPMLRFLPGSARLKPVIPTPDAPFEINIRVDNLGETQATNLKVSLAKQDYETGLYGDFTDDVTLNLVPGSETGSGNIIARFADMVSEPGVVSYRATLTGSGVEFEHSKLFFNVTVGYFNLGSKSTLSLATKETPLEFVGLPDGGLLFTTRDGELHVRTISSSLAMPGDILLENDWGGELAVYQREDGLVQAAWSRRSINAEGYTLTDIAMTSISAAGKTTAKHYHMQPLKLTEGTYHGFTFDEYDGTMVLAGYHRDLSTGGSWQDITSIFVISSSTPDRGPSWGNAVTVLANVDISNADSSSLGVALGNEYLHILYHEYREDVTGIKRAGLMYTHGEFTESSWTFQSSVGDNVGEAALEVIVVDGEDRLVGAWIEGMGRTTTVVTAVTDSVWSISEPNHLLSPGATSIHLQVRSEGVYLYHDEINYLGPVVRWGLMADKDGQAVKGLSNLLIDGILFGISSMEEDTLVCSSSTIGVFALHKQASLAGNQDSIKSSSILDLLLGPLPGTDATKRLILAGAILTISLFLVGVIVAVRRSHSRDDDGILVSDGHQDGIEIMIQPEQDDGPLLSVDGDDSVLVASNSMSVVMEDELVIEDPTLSQELERKVQDGEGNARLQRRMVRKQQREVSEMVATMPLPGQLPPLPLPGELPLPGQLPPLPLPGELPLASQLPPMPLPGELPLPGIMPLPEIKRDAQCPECNAAFTVKDLMLKRIKCPICSTAFDL